MTSSNGNIFRVTGYLCGEFIGHWWNKRQWRGALMFSLICAWIKSWANNRDASDLRCHRAHYDVSIHGGKERLTLLCTDNAGFHRFPFSPGRTLITTLLCSKYPRYLRSTLNFLWHTSSPAYHLGSYSGHSVYDIVLTWCVWHVTMTSSNGNIFSVIGNLWGESTGHRWISLAKASDAELWCFLLSTPEQTIEQTMETPVIWNAIALIMMSLWY